jgi:toxin YoeB
MIYEIVFAKQALKDIADLKKTDALAFKKVKKLLEELIDHPYTGTGNPELLKYDYTGFYSRRISQKHRLIYSVNDNEIIVSVVSAKGHYNDK